MNSYLLTPLIAMKFAFFFALVRSLVKYEPIQKHCLFLAVLYTCAAGFLRYVFDWSMEPVFVWTIAGKWLGLTLLISWVYFRLLVRFEEGLPFWILIIVGIAIPLF